MEPYVTGSTIRQLREQKQLTQAQLAQALAVSDKTISKWETAKGLPDISLLEPLAACSWSSCTRRAVQNAAFPCGAQAHCTSTATATT